MGEAGNDVQTLIDRWEKSGAAEWICTFSRARTDRVAELLETLSTLGRPVSWMMDVTQRDKLNRGCK